MSVKPELLAPAGSPDAGYAALHYGADAVYLGLDRFSARAEAVNFTPEELAEFVAYAHSLSPARNVYLTLNTLLKNSELAGAAETLLVAAECGVDAVIVQDLGVAGLVRDRFPGIRLHASTQMAIHSLEGVLAAQRLGCSRVTLARELTLDEVSAIASAVDIEIETFIHGTLCYSYSGLCLFSSVMSGRSGNRGRCVYSCREAADTPAGRAHPFSLKDMALGERVLDLARVGVASLKIEGRKKSPLYVAATVDHYRRILDGTLKGEAAIENAARLKTIFARPWTTLFLDSPRNPDAADPDVVGHRGAPIGQVRRIVRTPAGPGVAFRPDMAVERHDGLQIDIPGEARPYGFPVDNLFTVNKSRLESVFEVAAGTEAVATLPEDAPIVSPGLSLYLSSSQAVKRSYPYSRPKAGAFGIRLPVDVSIVVFDGKAACSAELTVSGFLSAAYPDLKTGGCACAFEEPVETFPARDEKGAEQAARKSFSRTGDGVFQVAGWRFDNPGNLFVRPGDWNRLRRRLLADLADKYAALQREVRDGLTQEVARVRPSCSAEKTSAVEWMIFAEQPEFLAEFTESDFAACKEVALGTGEKTPERLHPLLESLAEKIGRDRIVLTPPLVRRANAAKAAARQMLWLRDNGWRRWLVGDLAAWRILTGDNAPADMELTADWPLYCLNRLAAERLLSLGFSSFTLSPEDDADNWSGLLAAFADRAWVLAYSDLPLFISAACAHAHIGLCRSGGTAVSSCVENKGGMRISMERSGEVDIWPQICGSVVTGARPYSHAGRLDDLSAIGAYRLRADFRWRRYGPGETAAIWRTLRSETAGEEMRVNFGRGLR